MEPGVGLSDPYFSLPSQDIPQLYDSTTYSTVAVMRGHQAWQMAAFTVGYTQDVCTKMCNKATPILCPPRHYVLRWKKQQQQHNNQQVQEPDLQIAGWQWEYKQERKIKQRVAPTSATPCPLCLGGLYSFPLPRVLTAC